MEALDVDSDDRGRPKKVCSDQMRLQQYLIMFLLNICRFYRAVKNQNTFNNFPISYIFDEYMHLMYFFREMMTLIRKEVEVVVESQEIFGTTLRTRGELGLNLPGNAVS